MATPDDYPLGTIAKLLDLTERRVNQLTAEGVIPKVAFGRYQIVPVVQGYIRYLRRRAINGDPGSADEFGTSRTALVKARARMATVEADQFEGQLLRRTDVEKTWIAILTNVRTRLLAIPATTAQSIVHLTTPAQVAGLLTDAVTEALDDINSTPIYVVDPARSSDAEPAADGAGRAQGAEAAADADSVAIGGSEPDAVSRCPRSNPDDGGRADKFISAESWT